jgi:glucokinase
MTDPVFPRLSESNFHSFVVGIDLGATNVRAGAFTEAGEMLAVRQVDIEAHKGVQPGLERIASVLEQVIRDAQGDQETRQGAGVLRGVGIGSTGPSDVYKGVLLNPETMPGWVNVPIVSWMEDRFSVPACLENDADVAALGEYWMGAGQGVSRLYAITVGTGIGTACVIDGQIYRGLNGFHPEGGHQIIDPSGPLCYCGAHGCWESLSSGAAIARRAQALYPLEGSNHPASSNPPAGSEPAGGSLLIDLAQGDPDKIDARIVAEAARQGDPLARQIIEQAAQHFALGVFNLLMLFFPEVIVLSGGVMKSLDLFMPAIQQAVKTAQPYIPAGEVRILPAQLGYYAGLYGAAYAILRK